MKSLPARAEGYPWTLVYSSDKHGFSLKTLYRSMSMIDSPILLIIKDTNNQVIVTSRYYIRQSEDFIQQYHHSLKSVVELYLLLDNVSQAKEIIFSFGTYAFPSYDQKELRKKLLEISSFSYSV